MPGVYVLFSGDYEARGAVRAFLTLEEAQAHAPEGIEWRAARGGRAWESVSDDRWGDLGGWDIELLALGACGCGDETCDELHSGVAGRWDTLVRLVRGCGAEGPHDSHLTVLGECPGRG